jgi:hypothetical protein
MNYVAAAVLFFKQQTTPSLFLLSSAEKRGDTVLKQPHYGTVYLFFQNSTSPSATLSFLCSRSCWFVFIPSSSRPQASLVCTSATYCTPGLQLQVKQF